MNDVVEKKSRKKIVAYVVGGVVLAGSVAAWAGAKSFHRHGHFTEHAVDHISEELELNDGQRAQLEEFGATLMNFKRTMRNGDEVDIILASVQGGALDQQALNALIESKLDTARAQSPTLVASAASFFDGLDTEQQAKARSRLAEMAEWASKKRRGHDHEHN